MEDSVGALAAEIQSRSQALRVYLVSSDAQLDGRVLDLEQGLRLVVWARAGTLISVVPGQLAIYLGERLNGALILQRNLQSAAI